MRSMTITFFGLFFILFNSMTLQAQDAVTEWRETVELDGDNLKKEVKIKVLETSSYIKVKASGTISGGNICIQLCNPDGKSQTSLSICASANSNAKGSLEEKLEATPGVWLLCINNSKASGKLDISVSQN